jgi:hypothetical protein
MRGPTGLATTGRATRIKRIILVAAMRTERIPCRRTVLRATSQQTARRTHVLRRRAIPIRIGLTTMRRGLITRVRIQLIGPPPNIIQMPPGRSLPRGNSRVLRGLRHNSSSNTVFLNSSNTVRHNSSSAALLSSNTMNLDRKANLKDGILTQSRNVCFCGQLLRWAIRF